MARRIPNPDKAVYSTMVGGATVAALDLAFLFGYDTANISHNTC